MSGTDPFFVVTSTGKNCDPLPCLRSVAEQTYPHFRHKYIANDAHTTAEAAMFEPKSGRLPLLEFPPYQRTVVENVYRYWQTLSDSDVVVWLDGDDPLAHARVLERLAEIYREKDPWLTYGSFRFDPPCGVSFPHFGTRYPTNDFRRDVWRASHLKTFRAGLVKRVLEESLRRPDGSWTEYCTDRVFMLPMLEMTGERYEAVSEVLSVYNFAASFSATNRDPQKTVDEENERARIHALPKYEMLKEKPW